MDKLLIIADDFTGALDTGIQFTKMGIRAKIITDYQYDFQRLTEEYPLLVVNTDSRPLLPEDAYRRVYELCTHAKEAGFRYVYKKTDSALRGNIGMELKAVMDAYEEHALYFVPALPDQNRITKDGIQYIDGVKVKDSVFGKDPFEPVLYSDIAEIIHAQTSVAIQKIPTDGLDDVVWGTDTAGEQTILLFDAETDSHLSQIAETLKKKTKYHICAGCAGFATTYGTLLDFPKGSSHSRRTSGGLFGLCGSVNAITARQLFYAGEHGFTRANLRNEQKLDREYFSSGEGQTYLDELFREVLQTDKFLLDTLDSNDGETVAQYAGRKNLKTADMRFRIADALGRIAAEMVDRGLDYTISMTGGDTLMGFMRVTNTTELEPVCEIGKGAVMSVMRWKGKEIQVISKSGGFGEEDIFLKMYEAITG